MVLRKKCQEPRIFETAPYLAAPDVEPGMGRRGCPEKRVTSSADVCNFAHVVFSDVKCTDAADAGFGGKTA